MSRMVLKKYYPDIKIREVKNARYLLFKKTDGGKEIIDLNIKYDPYGILFLILQNSPRLRI